MGPEAYGLQSSRVVHDVVVSSVSKSSAHCRPHGLVTVRMRNWKTSQCVVLVRALETACSCGAYVIETDLNPALQERDEHIWTSLISQHAKCGENRRALKVYEEMRKNGVKPSSYTFVAVLRACSGLKDLNSARRMHADVVESGSHLVVNVGNILVDVYCKCGSLADARKVFESMPHRNVVSWTAIILGYANMEKGEEALQLYAQMQREGVKPNDRTFVGALKACSVVAGCHDGDQAEAVFARKECLKQVEAIHSSVMIFGCQSSVYVATMLVDAYAKCGSLLDARAIFDSMPHRNVVSWTAMILGHAQMEQGVEALHLYARMQQDGVVPNDRTFVGVLKACSSMAGLETGEEIDGVLVKKQCLENVRVIHSHILESQPELDVYVGTMLVDVYAKCGSLVDARDAFEKMPRRDVVSWNAMISGHTQTDAAQAVQLYARMQHERVVPNAQTFLVALKACSRLAAAKQGVETAGRHQCLQLARAIHSDVVKNKLESVVALGNMLVDVYARCGSLVDARNVFDKMPQRSVVSWNATVLAYAQSEQADEALLLYARMQQEGVAPDEGTFIGALKACGVVAGLEMGKEIHSQVQEAGMDVSGLSIATSLVDMYCKCGSMENAQLVFDSMPRKDVVTWGALIAGYAHQGECRTVFELFRRMRQDGIQPDNITFLSLLTACSHAGLVDEGHRYFEAMTSEYGITPTIDHHTCLIDLLGRAGKLDKAMELAKMVPSNSVVWKAVLSACQKWADVEIGRQAFECALSVNKNDAAAYVLMGNIYAAAHMPQDAQEVRAMRVRSGAWKKPGQSWGTDSSGNVHTFQVGAGETQNLQLKE